jgi:hypothetical protein
VQGMRAATRQWVRDALQSGSGQSESQWTEALDIGQREFVVTMQRDLYLRWPGRLSVGGVTGTLDACFWLRKDAFKRECRPGSVPKLNRINQLAWSDPATSCPSWVQLDQLGQARWSEANVPVPDRSGSKRGPARISVLLASTLRRSADRKRRRWSVPPHWAGHWDL